MELEKYKYDITAKQNDLFDQIRIQLDERNDQYVEDRVRFYNDKMQEISMEQNNQFNKHVEFMDKKTCSCISMDDNWNDMYCCVKY